METTTPCPACGQPNALLALGARLERPHRWRPWIGKYTLLYLCDRCDAIMAIPEARPAVMRLRTWPGRASGARALAAG